MNRAPSAEDDYTSPHKPRDGSLSSDTLARLPSSQSGERQSPESRPECGRPSWTQFEVQWRSGMKLRAAIAALPSLPQRASFAWWLRAARPRGKKINIRGRAKSFNSLYFVEINTFIVQNSYHWFFVIFLHSCLFYGHISSSVRYFGLIFLQFNNR